MYLQAGNLALFRSRDLNIINLVASMNGSGKIFAALLDPFDSMSSFHRSKGGNKLFGVDIEFTPKTTTNFRHDHTNLVLWEAHSRRENIAQQVRNLRRTPDR